MTRLSLLVPLLGLSAAVAVACSESGTTPNPGSGGEANGGDASGGTGDTSNGGAAAGETTVAGAAGDNAAGACSTDGAGKLTITVTGLPDGVDALVVIGSGDLNVIPATKTMTIDSLTAGDYKLGAGTVFDEDPIVRTAFQPTVSATEFCLPNGGALEVKVDYAPIATSNKLWMPTAKDDELAGFTSAQLAASGSKVADVAIDGPGSKSVAFDQDGNLWALGPTVADPMIVRFKAGSLEASGKAAPDIEINVPEIACVPAINHLVFDAAGNLWLSACGDEVHRLAAADLTTSGDKASDVLIAGLVNNEGIAFDKAGNLWITGDGKLSRFDAARLDTSTSDPADLALAVSITTGNVNVAGTELAFDQGGNLWGLDPGLNIIFQITDASLALTGDKAVKAEHAFHFDGNGLGAGIAFDEGNGLWLSVTAGTIGRFSPTQIAVNKGTGENVVPETVIKSSSIDTELPVAFFPAPAGLPLYHAIPTL